jgi:large subunit ribosomal protein L7Ae
MPKAESKGKSARDANRKAIQPTERALNNKHRSRAKGPMPSESLYVARPKNFGIGRDVMPNRDVTRFVRWPRYIKVQRMKRILYNRLKVPPPIAQFSRSLDKEHAVAVFKLLHKYRPESEKQKKLRLRERAAAKAAARKAKPAEPKPPKGTPIVKKKKAPLDPTKKPYLIKYGLNHVTKLIEQKKAKLVIIAHDVDPIELVLWLPALCRRQGVPFVIVKGKSRLGMLVHKKTASVVVLDSVRKEDQAELAQITTLAKEQYNDKYDEVRRQWGGQRLGVKSQVKQAKQRANMAKAAVLQPHNK